VLLVVWCLGFDDDGGFSFWLFSPPHCGFLFRAKFSYYKEFSAAWTRITPFPVARELSFFCTGSFFYLYLFFPRYLRNGGFLRSGARCDSSAADRPLFIAVLVKRSIA